MFSAIDRQGFLANIFLEPL